VKIKRAGTIVLIAAVAALLLVQASGGAQSGTSDLDYQRTTASNALAMLEQQVAQAPVPDRVQKWLDKGRQHTEQLLSAANPKAARKHFRKATRAFARISQFLREREGEPDDSPLTPEQRLQRLQRLQERLDRMNRRQLQLSNRAERQGVALDFSAASELAAAAQQALASQDLRAARAALKELKTRLLELQDTLEDALEQQEGGQ